MLRTSGFIDRIALTIDVAAHMRDALSIALGDLIYDTTGNFGPAYVSERTEDYERFRIYHQQMWLYLSPEHNRGRNRVFVQFSPTQNGHSFFRFEWNPKKLGMNVGAYIVRLMSQYVEGFEALWTDAEISRLDIAVDLLGKAVEPYMMFSNDKRTTVWPHFSNGGTLNAVYLGARRSDKQVLVYDKHFELHCKRLGIKRTREIIEARMPYTRVEFRLRNLKRGRDIALNQLLNLLEGFHFVDSEKLSVIPRWVISTMFRDHCEVEGAQNALRQIHVRRKLYLYREQLIQRCKPNWDAREIIVAQAHRAMRKILLLEELPNLQSVGITNRSRFGMLWKVV